jgi:hypothetical protein
LLDRLGTPPEYRGGAAISSRRRIQTDPLPPGRLDSLRASVPLPPSPSRQTRVSKLAAPAVPSLRPAAMPPSEPLRCHAPPSPTRLESGPLVLPSPSSGWAWSWSSGAPRIRTGPALSRPDLPPGPDDATWANVGACRANVDPRGPHASGRSPLTPAPSTLRTRPPSRACRFRPRAPICPPGATKSRRAR